MDNIKQSSDLKHENDIRKLENAIIDKKIIINKIRKHVLQLLDDKDSLEKSRNEMITFMKSSFIKRLKYVKPGKRDLNLFTLNALINIILGIAVGIQFLPFGLLFIGVFYYGSRPYFNEAIKKWKTLKNGKPEAIEIKIDWKDVEIERLNRTIAMIKDEIADLESEIKDIINHANQLKDTNTYSFYETINSSSIEDDSNYCKSYKK